MDADSLEFQPVSSAGSFVQLCQAAEAGLIKYGFLNPLAGEIPDTSPLAGLSLARIGELVRDLTLTIDELRRLDTLGTLTSQQKRSADIEQLMRFLDQNRLHLKDESIFDLIGNDDVLEVYDHRSIQIWRNWAFFKVCPYSLFELLVNDWNTLFVRPTWVVDKLVSMIPLMFVENAQTRVYDIPEYLLRARKFPNAKGMLFKMKYVSTIYNHVGQPVAVLTTGSLRVLPEVEAGQRVDFI